MYEQILTSLAILKVHNDQGEDYIENFVPFIAECVRSSPHPEVALVDLQKDVENQFGLHIPQSALNTIVNRAQKRGFFKRENGVLRRDEEKFIGFNFSTTRQSVLQRQESLIRKLIDFSGREFGKPWTYEVSEAALLSYLGEHSVPILTAAVEGSAIPLIAQAGQESGDAGHYLVASFVNYLSEADEQGFTFLETMVKGRMLADVLIFPDLNRVANPFDNVTFYFDTPFLIRLLGFNGESIQAPCLELINALRKQQAPLRVFSHTFDETGYALEAVARALKSPKKDIRHTQAIDYAIRADLTASDIDIAIENLRGQMKNYDIDVEYPPLHSIPLGLDEAKLRQTLRDEVKYQHDETMEKDLSSVTAIHRLRAGRVKDRLENCTAIFVTCNDSLARAGARFFRQEYQGVSVPHCILDHVLTTVMWLKSPLKTKQDLPRKLMIANCFAAMNPNDTLWRKYLTQINKERDKGTITQNDYYLLRGSHRILMEKTYGDEKAFTEGTWNEVLAQARLNAIKEAEDAVRKEHGIQMSMASEEHERQRILHQEEIAQQQQLYQTKQQELDAEKFAKEAAQNKWASAEALRLSRIAEVDKISQGIGKFVGKSALYLSLIIFVLGLLVAVPLPAKYTPIFETRYKIYAYVIVIAFSFLSIVHWLRGSGGMDIGEYLEKWAYRTCKRVLMTVKSLYA